MNPFPSKFDSECQECEEMIEEGESMFSDNGQFICIACAEEKDAVCECGNYKKPEFPTCFECKDEI
jgi:hypothetical protein